jgi:hypothetical protein
MIDTRISMNNSWNITNSGQPSSVEKALSSVTLSTTNPHAVNGKVQYMHKSSLFWGVARIDCGKWQQDQGVNSRMPIWNSCVQYKFVLIPFN